ncbi:MAG: hypothetical protein QXE86_03935 [Archaeoglobaceae archaeon]
MSKLYRALRRGYCIVSKNEVRSYLLSKEEDDAAKKIIEIVKKLPDDFEIGYFNAGMKMCVYKSKDKFLIFPMREDNILELLKELRGVDDAIHSEEG